MSLMNLSAVTAHFAELRAIGASLVKEAGDAKKVHALSGKLYLSTSGWLLLSVPNALVRGAFDAMNEIGIELPPQKAGRLNAHITVMRPEEVEKLGGPDKITERGHNFHYTLGEVKECEPAGWSEMSKCWFIEVSSPELEKLRKSYGLSATPKDGEHEFHITIAVKRKRVTHPGDEVTKQSAEEAAFLERTKAAMPQEMMALGMLDDVLMYHLARWRAHKAKQQVALSQPAPPKPALLEEPKTAAAIDELRNAKALSDKRDYAGKTNILRKLMKEKPDDWAVDSEDKGIAGLTHMPTRFRLHLPSHHIHDLRKGFGTMAKKAGVWDDTPDVVKLPLRGGEQKVCPRCAKPVLHDLYTDRKGWTFHRSCFGKGKGPVGDTEKQAVTAGLVERARAALTARAAAGDAAAATRLAKFEGTRQKWLVGKPMGPRDLPGGHLGRSLTAAGRGDSKSLSELISTLGTAAGTDHKRLAISDELMSGNGLKQLGFRNGSVAVPETGQKGLHNLRHVENNFHLHPHDGFWTVHEDAHPSIPMAVRKAKGPLSKLKAVGTGSRHVLEEGVPGWYKWVTNTLTGGRPILHAMAAESPNAIIKGTAPREVAGWNPSQLRQFGPTTGLSFGAGALGTAALSDGSK